MNQSLLLFVLFSTLLHGALLLSGDNTARAPQIGGQQRALQVRVAAPAPREPVAHRPQQALTTPAEQVRAALPARAPVHAAPAARIHTAALETVEMNSGPAVHEAESAAQTPPRVAVSRAVSQRISEALRRRLAQHFHYPRLARRHGWEGRVTLSLRVEGNGQLSNLRIVRTSGYQVLDRSALESVRRIKSLPEASGWLHGDGLNLQIPVQYRLVDS